MTVQNIFKVGEGLNKTLSFKNTIPPSNIGVLIGPALRWDQSKLIRYGPLEKLWGSKFLVWIFLGRSMNIF